MKEIKLNVPDEKASAFAEEFLNLCKKHGVGVDGITPAKDDRPVTERIKTFEDALADLNKRAEKGDKTAVELVDDWNGLVTDSTELIAYHKIRIIAYALNEGWEPTFEKGEYRWAPWFDLYTQSEIDNMDDEDKGRVLGRSAMRVRARVWRVRSLIASADSSSALGGRLCFKSEALAEYAGTQFLKEWSDLMMFTK